MSQKKVLLPSLEMKEPVVQRETFSYSLMTTLSALRDGSSQLLKLSILKGKLEGFLDLLPFLDYFEGTGTYSNSDSSSSCTINFFVEEDSICLDIYANQEPGPQELVNQIAITTEKLTSLKLVIALTLLNFFMLLVVSMKVIWG